MSDNRGLLVDRVRTLLVAELRKFGEGEVHPNWKEAALKLVADLEAKRPAVIGGRIFPEFLDGAIEKVGVKLYSPDYRYIRTQLESPGTSG